MTVKGVEAYSLIVVFILILVVSLVFLSVGVCMKLAYVVKLVFAKETSAA